MKKLIGLVALVCWMGLFGGGCATTDQERADRVELFGDLVDEAIARLDDAHSVSNEPVPVVPPVVVPDRGEGTPSPVPPSVPSVPSVANDFAGISKFRNSADCSKWPVTVQISNVGIRGGNIQWDEAAGQREARKWNEKRGKKAINGETIILIPSRGEAGMFDFLRVGQRDKILSNLKPGHEGPGFFAPWQPVKGERIGFCIATISRDKPFAKMQERSNVVWLTIP